MTFLNYHHLRYFWATVKEGGVTRASRRLHVSQPTVSSQIRELEDVLDQPLLNRESQKLALTDAGRICYRYAEQIFELGRDMVDELNGQPPGRAFALTVGLATAVPKPLVHQLLTPALGLPALTRVQCFDDRLEHLIDGLVSHELDLVLADAPLPPMRRHRVCNHLLGESAVHFVATAPLAAAARGDFPRSLAGVPMLLPTQNTSLRRSLEAWFAARGITPRVVGEFDDPALMQVFGEAGAGVFPVVAALESHARLRGGMCVLGPADGVVERFYAIAAERRVRHPAVVAIASGAVEPSLAECPTRREVRGEGLT